MEFISQAAGERGNRELDELVRHKPITIRIQKQRPVHAYGARLDYLCVHLFAIPVILRTCSSNKPGDKIINIRNPSSGF